MGFGLTEKEANCYFYLFKYGPKTPSPLAKALQTYNEDVRRTLKSLVDKGMVLTSHHSPTIYAAVELETALEFALKKHESELMEMERRKQELEELSRQQRFYPSEEVSTFKMLKSVREVLAVILPALASAEREWLAVVPPIMTIFSVLFVIEGDKEFLDRGGSIRFITDITYPYIEVIQQHLDAGMEVRHFDKYEGLLFGVFDEKIGLSVVNAADVTRVSLSVPVSVLWSDDPAYAQYLSSTFELLWQQATPAEERIRELREQGPPQADH